MDPSTRRNSWGIPSIRGQLPGQPTHIRFDDSPAASPVRAPHQRSQQQQHSWAQRPDEAYHHQQQQQQQMSKFQTMPLGIKRRADNAMYHGKMMRTLLRKINRTPAMHALLNKIEDLFAELVRLKKMRTYESVRHRAAVQSISDRLRTAAEQARQLIDSLASVPKSSNEDSPAVAAVKEARADEQPDARPAASQPDAVGQATASSTAACPRPDPEALPEAVKTSEPKPHTGQAVSQRIQTESVEAPTKAKKNSKRPLPERVSAASPRVRKRKSVFDRLRDADSSHSNDQRATSLTLNRLKPRNTRLGSPQPRSVHARLHFDSPSRPAATDASTHVHRRTVVISHDSSSEDGSSDSEASIYSDAPDDSSDVSVSEVEGAAHHSVALATDDGDPSSSEVDPDEESDTSHVHEVGLGSSLRDRLGSPRPAARSEADASSRPHSHHRNNFATRRLQSTSPVQSQDSLSSMSLDYGDENHARDLDHPSPGNMHEPDLDDAGGESDFTPSSPSVEYSPISSASSSHAASPRRTDERQNELDALLTDTADTNLDFLGAPTEDAPPANAMAPAVSAAKPLRHDSVSSKVRERTIPAGFRVSRLPADQAKRALSTTKRRVFSPPSKKSRPSPSRHDAAGSELETGDQASADAKGSSGSTIEVSSSDEWQDAAAVGLPSPSTIKAWAQAPGLEADALVAWAFPQVAPQRRKRWDQPHPTPTTVLQLDSSLLADVRACRAEALALLSLQRRWLSSLS